MNDLEVLAMHYFRPQIFDLVVVLTHVVLKLVHHFLKLTPIVAFLLAILERARVLKSPEFALHSLLTVAELSQIPVKVFHRRDLGLPLLE